MKEEIRRIAGNHIGLVENFNTIKDMVIHWDRQIISYFKGDISIV